MPASDNDVEEALREGVEIQFLAAPTEITRTNGQLKVKCIRMKLGKVDASGRPRPEPIPGSEFYVDTNAVIVAIGEAPDIPAQFGLKKADGNAIWVDPETLVTSKNGVFAGGDVVSGPASIIESIAAGRRAAISIDKYLGGNGEIDEALAPPEKTVRPLDADELPEESRVPKVAAMSLAKRLFSFDMPECGYTAEEAVKEANRCLRCDADWIYTVNEDKCKGCHNCKVICPVKDCISMKVVA
jgi:formate dehydrogenase beta subunit